MREKLGGKGGVKGKRGGKRERTPRVRTHCLLPRDDRFWDELRIADQFGEAAVKDGRVSDPRVIDYLQKSNAIADTWPGRKDLRKRRRRWIPRDLEDGLPLFPPDLPPHTPTCRYRLLILVDELDFTVTRFSPTSEQFPDGVRLAASVSHADFRGMTGWKSSLLDKRLHAAPESLPLRIDDGASGVKFDPVDTARWLLKRKNARSADDNE